jgi:homocysteine S-methyltransferase
MNDPIKDLLASRPLMVLDGALATELERRGADLRDPLWSAKYLIERPDIIRSVHFDYFRAGADVATTATYQATFQGFARRGIGGVQAAHLMRGAVALAGAARDEFWGVEANRVGRRRPLVAASVGPYGAMLADGSEYRGHYAATDRTLEDFHRPRLAVLAACGADLLACETIPCLREAKVLARLLMEFPELSAWISFSCQDESHNCEGEDMAACVAQLGEYPQIAAVGVNCSRPELMTPLLRQMRGHTDKPLLVYPNSGERYDAKTKHWSGSVGTARFGHQAREWYAEGARLIGGCCRTTPEDIRGVRSCAEPDRSM